MKSTLNITNTLLFLTLLTIGCSPKTYHHLRTYQYKSETGVPNYQQLDYWAAHPAKWDPSDSLPNRLMKERTKKGKIGGNNSMTKETLVDVFFLHPTSLTDFDDPRTTAPVDDAKIQAKTDYSSILYQASVFNEDARVFAPRYRQAHLRTFYITDTVVAQKIFDTAYQDIKAAFEHYLQQENNNRPFIIAAHSQGTRHAAQLMKEYIDGKPLQNKLIAAYIIGLPVPKTLFTTIPVCSDPNQTGCVVSWRTYQRGTTRDPILDNETIPAIVVNPLSWDTTSTRISRKENKGSVLKNFKRLKAKVTDAEIHNNILWSIKPRFFGNFLLKTNNYHIGDINLFYLSIRENVKQRIAAYWKR